MDGNIPHIVFILVFLLCVVVGLAVVLHIRDYYFGKECPDICDKGKIITKDITKDGRSHQITSMTYLSTPPRLTVRPPGGYGRQLRIRKVLS